VTCRAPHRGSFSGRTSGTVIDLTRCQIRADAVFDPQELDPAKECDGARA